MKVKKNLNQANIQGFRIKFEYLNMYHVEYISKYFLRVDEVVNTIIGLDETLKEHAVVQKVLISLLKRFNIKFSSIKEMINLKTLTLEKLLSMLTTYEMRVSMEILQ